MGDFSWCWFVSIFCSMATQRQLWCCWICSDPWSLEKCPPITWTKPRQVLWTMDNVSINSTFTLYYRYIILDGNQPSFVMKSCNPIECNKYAGHVIANLFLCVYNYFFFNECWSLVLCQCMTTLFSACCKTLKQECDHYLFIIYI